MPTMKLSSFIIPTDTKPRRLRFDQISVDYTMASRANGHETKNPGASRKKKILALAAIIILVVVIGVGGYFYYYK